MNTIKAPITGLSYQVCNRLLDPETNEHCEFDGDVEVNQHGLWRCPGCGYNRAAKDEGVDL